MIVSYRTHYPAIDGLINAGAQCIQADFSTNDGVMAFADEVLKSTHGLRAILHNASAWMAEKPGAPLADVLACMMQIHVNTPYLLNHALERLLRGHGHAASDIIHFTDYVVERGSDKHIAYAASKAALDNMTRSFARKLAPEVKVNSIAPSLILFNEHDDAEYRQQALNKSLMKTAPGEKESDRPGRLLTYQLFCHRTQFPNLMAVVHSALMQLYPAYNQHPCAYPPTRNRTNKSGGQAHHSGEIPQRHQVNKIGNNRPHTKNDGCA